MNSHKQQRQPNHGKFRPTPLLLGILVFAMGSCTTHPTRESQATSSNSTNDIVPAAELTRRTERSTTIPEGLERVPGKKPAIPITGEAPSALLDAIIADLMTQKNIKREEIAVIRAEAVIWPDGSLGCPRPGETYTHEPVRGFWVVLRAAQKNYDYRAANTRYFYLCRNPFKVQVPVG